MIKLAASAASPKTKIQESTQGSQRTTVRYVDGGGRQAPLDYWILVSREAALAANLIMAWKTIWGGCASSRLF